MNHFDVLIVGGGPAGSTLARRLISAGLKTAIIDKRQFPRDKTCAGWITPQVATALALDLEEYALNNVLQPIKGFCTSLFPGRQITTDYNKTISYGIRRFEFDNYLINRCNAELILGKPIKSISRRDGKWLLNNDLTSSLLIGAGGFFCPVARMLGARTGPGPTVITAQEVEYKMNDRQLADCAIDPEIPELFFLPDLSGYAWAIRKNGFMNIGIGRDNGKPLAELTAAFLDYLVKEGKVAPDIPKKFRGHAYLIHKGTARKIIDDHVLLIGDAAGLAHPQSGEGIFPAVESANIAAQVVIGAQGNYDKQYLSPYRDRLYNRIGKPKNSWVDQVLPVNLKKAIAKTLMNTSWFSKRILLDRWFLHGGPPRLAN